MTDKVAIFAGLVVFLILVTFPIWYSLGAAGDVSPPDLELPDDGSHCVEDPKWMIANHMNLLDQWRDAVVRDGQKQYTSSSGETYLMSLTGTCLGCHTNRETFCYRCHEYANVLPLNLLKPTSDGRRLQDGIRCWHCHVAPKGS